LEVERWKFNVRMGNLLRMCFGREAPEQEARWMHEGGGGRRAEEWWEAERGQMPDPDPHVISKKAENNRLPRHFFY